MRRIKSMMICFLVAAVAVGLAPTKAEACKYTQNCYSTSTSVACIDVREYGTTHPVFDENGVYIGTCNVSWKGGLHGVFCSGCHYLMYTDYRKCSEMHSHEACRTGFAMCNGRPGRIIRKPWVSYIELFSK